MKKILLTGGGFLATAIGATFLKNTIHKKIDKAKQKDLILFFEEKGYKVHSYNNHYDLILFHKKATHIKYVIVDHGHYKQKEFEKKLDAYYHHFTNHFYIIAYDENVLTHSSKPLVDKWLEKSKKERKNRKVTLNFTTREKIFDPTTQNPWETVVVE